MFLSPSQKHTLGLGTQSPQIFKKYLLSHGLLKFSNSYFCMTKAKYLKFYFYVHYSSFKTQFKFHSLNKALPGCSGLSSISQSQLNICCIIMHCFVKQFTQFACFFFFAIYILQQQHYLILYLWPFRFNGGSQIGVVSVCVSSGGGWQLLIRPYR